MGVRKNKGKVAADTRRQESQLSEVRTKISSLSKAISEIEIALDSFQLPDDTVVSIDGATKIDRAKVELETYFRNLLIAVSEAKVRSVLGG